MADIEHYLRAQFEQATEWSEGSRRSLSSLAINRVTLPHAAEDPRMSYEVEVTLDGFRAVIAPTEDGDGETSGSFIDLAILSEQLQTPMDYLDSLANAIWWAAGDAIFLSGLREPSMVLRDLSGYVRSTWGIGDS